MDIKLISIVNDYQDEMVFNSAIKDSKIQSELQKFSSLISS